MKVLNNYGKYFFGVLIASVGNPKHTISCSVCISISIEYGAMTLLIIASVFVLGQAKSLANSELENSFFNNGEVQSMVLHDW